MTLRPSAPAGPSARRAGRCWLRGAALGGLACLLLGPGSPRVATAEEPETPAATPSPQAEELLAWFQDGSAPRLKLTLNGEEGAKLAQDPRTYVHASLQEGSKTLLGDVGLKLKGSVGSFRELDDKPGFTVKVDKFQKEQQFHGLRKFHLNNSVQDPTFLAEFLGYEVFRAAGIPAPLVSHARVFLNGRDLGLYVVKEAYDKRFLARHFPDAAGNLYDGGFCTDIDTDLEQDAGPEDGAHADLHKLLEACREPSPAARKERLSAVLDVEGFLTFMALERMLCHWDGYSMNRNNYRLYVPRDGRAVFLPHGMDQLLGDPRVAVFDDPAAIVATAVLENAEWAAAYRKRVGELLPLLAASDRLGRCMDAALARLKPVLAGAESVPSGVSTLKSRLEQRVKNLRAQVAQPSPKAVALDKGEAFRINNWRPVSQAGGAKLAQLTLGNERVLRVEAGGGGDSAGSWRSRVQLLPGTYRFEASARTEGLAPNSTAAAGNALLVVSAVGDGPGLDGTQKRGWKPLSLEFEVKDLQANVEFAVELRASKGSAAFKLSSLRVVRLD